MPFVRSPAAKVLVAAHLCAALMLAAVWVVKGYPEVGLKFRPYGDQIGLMSDDGARIAVMGTDTIVTFRQGEEELSARAEELRPLYIPAGAPGQLDEWFSWRTDLAEMMRAGPVNVVIPAGEEAELSYTLMARDRDLADIRYEFWALLAAGAVAFLIGAWVWAFKSREWGARCYAISAFGLFVAAYSAAMYGAREIAANGALLWSLTIFNYLGSQLGFWALTAMFMNFPAPLVRPRWWHLWAVMLIVAAAAIGTAWLDLKLVFRSMFLAFVIMVILIVQQWMAVRKDTVQRAALSWIGLSVLLGTSIGVVLLIVPRLGGGPPVVDNSFALAAILITYGGVAIGVGRYRLFNLDRWAYRIIAVAIAAFILVLMDAALIASLNLRAPAALSLSIIMVALLYLPIRSFLWRQIAGNPVAMDNKMFQRLAEVALIPRLDERKAEWRALLKRIYDALEVEPTDEDVPVPALRGEGLEMMIPATSGDGALIIRYPGRGQRLFHAEHVDFARELLAFMGKADAARDSYRRGVLEERGRIARDLHDDVGARLLSSLHRPDVDSVRDDVRHAMDDIRTIVAGLAGEQIELDRMMSNLRIEAAERLEDAGVELKWPLAEPPLPERKVEPAIYRNLRSALREVISNVLRHARAKAVAIEAGLEGESLWMTIADDGVGLKKSGGGARKGQGISNLERRLEQVGGNFAMVANKPSGVIVQIAMPLATPKQDAAE